MKTKSLVFLLAAATLAINGCVEADTVRVARVSVNPTALQLTVGETATVTATVAPTNANNKNVTWSTSNATVATVAEGFITAIAKGDATITVSTVDGNKIATVSVTVRDSDVVPVVPPDTINAATPNISGQPTSAAYEQNTTATALTVTATASDDGTLTYQWYSNTANSNSGGTLIPSETAASYTPLTATVGTTYYYVVITNTNNSVNGTKTATATSNVAEITVTAPVITDAVAPNISGQPAVSASYTKDATAAALTVTATAPDGGTLSHQWYSNTTNSTSGGTLIPSETAPSYTPSTATVGTTYYYVEITNTNNSVSGTKTATATSTVATVTVTAPVIINAATPTISGQPAASAGYTKDATATALTVAATVSDGGTLSHQWYSNTASSTSGGTPITSATAASYTPPTSTVGTTYYYVEITNTNNSVNGTKTATVTSTVATVTVVTPTGSVAITITIGFNFDEVTVTGSDGNNIISKGEPTSLTLTATGYTNVKWYIDGSPTGITADSITIDAADYDTRKHSVTFTGVKNGIPYSKELPFTVNP